MKIPTSVYFDHDFGYTLLLSRSASAQITLQVPYSRVRYKIQRTHQFQVRPSKVLGRD